jgi:hypothetical protein
MEGWHRFNGRRGEKSATLHFLDSTMRREGDWRHRVAMAACGAAACSGGRRLQPLVRVGRLLGHIPKASRLAQ